jgi:uncharacterized membrane protein YfcA
MLIVSVVLYLVLGAITGVLSGLLGIGGGVIVVPALVWSFHHAGFAPNSVVHMAAATSLAVMMVTMLRALQAHSRYGVPYWSVCRRFVVGVALGAVGGAVGAHFLHRGVLGDILGVVLLLVAIRMVWPRLKKTNRCIIPGYGVSSLIGMVVGGFSGLLGIGGGSLMLPILSYCGLDMRRVVVVSIAVGLTAGVVGTVAATLTGLHAPNLPQHTIGYVYWPAWLGVALGGVLCVPLGTRLSHRAPVLLLQRIFAVILFAVGFHMVFHF